MPTATAENTALLPPAPPPPRRKIDRVPFVELFNNRLQGVVSASSDVERVYCAYIEAGTGDYYSSTNNNRPDAGMDKRLGWLAEDAVAQFGIERVARYLQIPGEPGKMHSGNIAWMARSRGSRKQEPAGTVFSRFLNYLRFIELQSGAGPVPEMNWFVAR